MTDYKTKKYISALVCISFFQEKESADLDEVIDIQMGMLSQYGIYVTKEQILEDIIKMNKGEQVIYKRIKEEKVCESESQGKIKSLVKAIRKII